MFLTLFYNTGILSKGVEEAVPVIAMAARGNVLSLAFLLTWACLYCL